MNIPPSPYPDGSPPAHLVPTDWTPALPWGVPVATVSSQPTSLPAEDNPRVVGHGRGRPKGIAVGEWYQAPPSSHISRFTYSDKTGVLNVIFKGADGHGEVAEYAYTFVHIPTGRDLFNRLRASPHPFGMVLYPDVIQGGVPYSPVFLSS